MSNPLPDDAKQLLGSIVRPETRAKFLEACRARTRWGLIGTACAITAGVAVGSTIGAVNHGRPWQVVALFMLYAAISVLGSKYCYGRGDKVYEEIMRIA